MIIQIEKLENNEGGHHDLLFKIPGLVETKFFDTYYFALAIEPRDGAEEIKHAIGELMLYWKNKLVESKEGEAIYLPIDFSDQYIGCVRAIHQNNTFTLSYGYTLIEGFAISPINPGDFYKNVEDFKVDDESQLIVNQSELISTLEKLILQFKNCTN